MIVRTSSNYKTFAILFTAFLAPFYALSLFVVLGITSVEATAAEPESSLPNELAELINGVDQHWATRRHKTRNEQVTPFLVPLGSMKKIRGIWRLESFESVSGNIQRITWSVEGESINEMYTGVAEQASALAERRWQCSSRACGNAAEWASRVYQERLLYGRDEFMNFTVFQTPQGQWITLFSAARTADRQYLHMDIVVPDSR